MWRMRHVLSVSSHSCSVFSWVFTMSVSSGDDGSVLDCAARGPGLAAEFRAGWEGWLEGACLAQLASDEEDAVRVVFFARGAKWFLDCS
jgi:hypothetical protein